MSAHILRACHGAPAGGRFRNRFSARAALSASRTPDRPAPAGTDEQRPAVQG
ncbi:hypothetical protein ACFPM0_30320 [Pseudonocardia sulfidoxydans]|uniref:hypothetical protein n=1 Tax=Pseudonocardia sulfidoxydans TaxID=54011 RepID=UPI0036180DAA